MDNDQVIAVNEEPAANGEAAAAEAPKKATRTRRKAAPKAKEAGHGPRSGTLPDLRGTLPLTSAGPVEPRMPERR